MKTRKIKGNTLEICSENDVIVSISENVRDGAMDIAVYGELRNEVAHDFEDELMAAFSVCKNVRVDMGKVTYIASIALRALLSVQQIIDDNEDFSLVVTNLSKEVKKIFAESGFMDILKIEN